MAIEYLFFIIGLIILIKGADWLVDGGSSLAKALGVSKLVIGLTIIAFGTSLPELTVNIFSSIANKSDVGLGNIIGSNIANIFLILGVTALFYTLKVKKSTVWKEVPFVIFVSVIFFLVSYDKLLKYGSENVISRMDGIVFLALFLGYLYYAYKLIIEDKALQEDIKETSSQKIARVFSKSTAFSVFLITIGLISLIGGGNLVINNIEPIALSLGISRYVISAILVAVGTSLPELMTSIVGAVKKEDDIIIGNIIGSNIFNILFVMGISAIISPVAVLETINIDYIFMICAPLILMILLGLSDDTLKRRQGIILLIFYLMYLLEILL